MTTTGDTTDLTRDTSLDTTTLPTFTIPTLASGSSYSNVSDFPANKWGYKKDSSDYIPFSSPTPLLENTVATNGDTTTLSFGSKIDYTQPSGAYKTTLIFTATTNPMVNYMQDLNPALCTTTPMTVVDKRDNKEYTIAKLPDGNCWMTQNLRYQGDMVGSTSTTTSWVMKSTTSNISTDTTMSMTDLTSGNTYDAARFHNSGNTTTGVWYNYAAASAMTITGSSNTNPQTYDICPKGWRLPTNSEQSGITSYASAYAPVTGGDYSNGSLSDTGSGFWWSSTSLSATNRNRLYWNGSSLSTGHNGRLYGFYIRCILNDPRTISDITTMQEMSPQIAAKMDNGDTATLKDSRDGQDYTIAKINGNVWMTRNLAIGCNGTGSTYGSTTISRTLTPNDTHVATSYSTPVDNDWSFSYDDAEQVCDSTYGAWYNYVASSAGTISGSSNSANASYDICPKEWRLPTLTEVAGITSGANITLFNRVLGGGYYGNQKQTERKFARWWTSTYGAPTTMQVLYYDPGTVANVRDSGYYVRCIAK